MLKALILLSCSLLFGVCLAQEESATPLYNVDRSDEDTLNIEAHFPGGSRDQQRFISERVQYPMAAIEAGEQGRVYVKFIVEIDGSITNIEIVRGVSESIDRECKRLVASMPNWIPGRSNGKLVRSRCTLPINFVLAGVSEEESEEDDKKKRRKRNK